MATYETEAPTNEAIDATGFGEISYDYAAATTPLSDFNPGEQTFGVDVNVEIEADEDEDDDGDDDDDDDEEEEGSDDGSNDGSNDGTSVVLNIIADGAEPKKKKKSKKAKKAKKSKKKLGAGEAAVKLTAFAVNTMANAAVSTNTAHAPGAIQTGQWSTGLFDCFNFCVPNCMMASFCPCVSAAQIGTRIGMSYMNVLILFGLAIGLDLIAYILLLATMNSSDDYASYYAGYYYYYSYSTTKFTAWGYIAIVISVLVVIAFWQLRFKVRERFQLPGSPVEDCCLSFFCSCCSLAQMATHVKSYTPGSCDFGAPDELPAYVE